MELFHHDHGYHDCYYLIVLKTMINNCHYIYIYIYYSIMIIVLRSGAARCPESSNGILNMILQHAQTPAQGQSVEISQTTNLKL